MIPRTFCSFYQAYKSQMALIYPDVVGFTMIAFRDKNFTFSIGDGLSGRHVEQGSALVFNDSSSQRGDKKIMVYSDRLKERYYSKGIRGGPAKQDLHTFQQIPVHQNKTRTKN